jgi:hypothetical protein
LEHLREIAIPDKGRQAQPSFFVFRSYFSHANPQQTMQKDNMKMLITKVFTGCVLAATLVAAEVAHAQTEPDRGLLTAPRESAPATANDSWESGVEGARVRVQPDDAIEDGRVAGEDPDPNIRSQLQREFHDGGDGN